MLLSESAPKDRWSAEQIDKLLFAEKHEQPVKSDFAILLGTAPKYAVKRAEIAAQYYRAGGASKIITTGGAVSDKTVTECAVMRDRLVELGVPRECIIEEPTALDTVQNMTCSATEIARHCNIYDVKTVTVITEPFHLRRALCLAKVFLPSFFKPVGFTLGTDEQRDGWQSDDRLVGCVKTEIELFKYYVSVGIIDDFEI